LVRAQLNWKSLPKIKLINELKFASLEIVDFDRIRLDYDEGFFFRAVFKNAMR
jgi:hypothetical protein